MTSQAQSKVWPQEHQNELLIIVTWDCTPCMCATSHNVVIHKPREIPACLMSRCNVQWWENVLPQCEGRTSVRRRHVKWDFSERNRTQHTGPSPDIIVSDVISYSTCSTLVFREGTQKSTMYAKNIILQLFLQQKDEELVQKNNAFWHDARDIHNVHNNV